MPSHVNKCPTSLGGSEILVVEVHLHSIPAFSFMTTNIQHTHASTCTHTRLGVHTQKHTQAHIGIHLYPQGNELTVNWRPSFIHCGLKALPGAKDSSFKSLLKIKSGSLGQWQENRIRDTVILDIYIPPSFAQLVFCSCGLLGIIPPKEIAELTYLIRILFSVSPPGCK